ncbi:MAG: MOSC domain-containing protein [Thermoplasmata archaeon]|nr:MOSC domain-containing protein [Thermoplasmata archaeon]
MRVVSVNVGLAEPLVVGGRPSTSAIRKRPVLGSVAVGKERLAGDDCADRRVHGGPDKAVYAYPTEHYDPWRTELGISELPWGTFGENLSLEGAHEDAIRIGDLLGIGTAELAVTRPRLPCAKLNARFARDDMTTRMLANARSGFYLAIRSTGRIMAGDEVRVLVSDPAAPTVLADFRRRAHSG